jgi:hypothetical protein
MSVVAAWFLGRVLLPSSLKNLGLMFRYPSNLIMLNHQVAHDQIEKRPLINMSSFLREVRSEATTGTEFMTILISIGFQSFTGLESREWDKPLAN